MAKKKACKRCRAFVEGDTCPVSDPDCPAIKHGQTSTNWQGRIAVLDANKSDIAKKIGVEVKAEYALKVR